jgi:curved DNA-binding protein CbpA
MVAVNRAWELLSDANRRGETDRLLRERAARAATAGPDASRSRASTHEPGDGQYTPSGSNASRTAGW